MNWSTVVNSRLGFFSDSETVSVLLVEKVSRGRSRRVYSVIAAEQTEEGCWTHQRKSFMSSLVLPCRPSSLSNLTLKVVRIIHKTQLTFSYYIFNILTTLLLLLSPPCFIRWLLLLLCWAGLGEERKGGNKIKQLTRRQMKRLKRINHYHLAYCFSLLSLSLSTLREREYKISSCLIYPYIFFKISKEVKS